MSHEEAIVFVTNFFISGTLSAFAKTLLAPVERTKLILQNQGSALQILTGERKPYKGALDVVRRLPKEQGFLSFWRGNGVNVIRIFPTQALGFAFYDLFQSMFLGIFPKANKEGGAMKLASGAFAGAAAAVATYPLQFCQTRLATDIGSDFRLKDVHVKREFTGLTDCVAKVYQTEGLLGYFKGVKAIIPGIMIHRGIYFGSYSIMKSEYLHRTSKSSKTPTTVIPSGMKFVIAQVVSMAAGLVAYPFDTIGRRMMLESARPKNLQLFTGTLDATVSLYRKEGIKIFYKGCIVNLLMGTSGAIVLVLYDEILQRTDWKSTIHKYETRRH